MMDNSTVVSELKENFRLSQPTPNLTFGAILFLVVEATNCLLINHSIMNVPGVIVVYKRLRIRISFHCKPLLIRIL